MSSLGVVSARGSSARTIRRVGWSGRIERRARRERRPEVARSATAGKKKLQMPIAEAFSTDRGTAGVHYGETQNHLGFGA